MTPERWAQIEELFHRAAECDPARRSRLLDEVCGNDPELQQELEALLSRDGSAGCHVQAAVQFELNAIRFPLTGETVSHYRILDGVGGGGMGLVYRAEDIKLGRRVALKFLPEESAKDPVAIGRFEREARSASALEHPNICPVYEFGEHEGQPFLVMQLLEGQTLRECLSGASPKKPPLPLDKLLDLAIQILDGLDAAHLQGIVHRDIKPANVFVTSQGQAKILDFGLAKLAQVVEAGDGSDRRDGGDTKRAPREEVGPTTPDLSLSRTGAAMGTAGYMSPEQVRGEKLDARTDLFSFGLMLYEMATGKRAFTGDTGPIRQEAILKQIPVPARGLPVKLERIIRKALEKDLAARYQTASDIRGDLEMLKRQLEPSNRLRRWAVASGVVAILLMAGAAFWFTKRQPPRVPEIKVRQLTANSVENRVRTGAISPDGKFLAYGDTRRLYVKLIETGETQIVPTPDSLRDSVRWEIIAWSPDDARLLVNAYPTGSDPENWSSQGASIWSFPVRGGGARKLRDDARAYSMSPDGSSIAFGAAKGRFGDREIWLMGSAGQDARKLYDTDERSWIGGVKWSSDGKRVLYFRIEANHISFLSGDVQGGAPITMLLPGEVTDLDNLYDALWLRDGRLIYSLVEPGTLRITCTFWQMRLAPHTGKPLEPPRRLTNWSDHCMSDMSATADSKRLAFKKWEGRFTTYLADLKPNGTLVSAPEHFTLTESADSPSGWTLDSKALIFWSNRSGQIGIYKQALAGDSAEPLVTGAGDVRDARISADGKWVLYKVYAKSSDGSASLQIMRVPISGGASQLVFNAQADSLIFCPQRSSGSCVIAGPSQDGKRIIFTTLDPLKGRGSELLRFDLDPNDNFWAAALSPDGTRIAALRNHAGPIHLLSLRGQPPEEVRVRGANNMQTVDWAADGAGFFVSNSVQGGAALLLVNLQGEARVLWQTHGGTRVPVRPSPDGRHLAIQAWTIDCNVWMMENF